LYSNGLNTGFVVDSGHSVTYAAPVFEGFCILNDIDVVFQGGNDVNLNLQKLLKNVNL